MTPSLPLESLHLFTLISLPYLKEGIEPAENVVQRPPRDVQPHRLPSTSLSSWRFCPLQPLRVRAQLLMKLQSCSLPQEELARILTPLIQGQRMTWFHASLGYY